MTPRGTQILQFAVPEGLEQLPLSLLNDFLYCPRRAALKIVEGWRLGNEHTSRGDIVHEHTDLAGYEVVKGVTLLRALPVWSERLGLSGKCDIVEVHSYPAGGGSRPSERREAAGERRSLFPVEFKLGKRRQWENDDAQLCAQALCLEEMFHVAIPRGAVFHADSKRRREVDLTEELRARTEAGIHALRRLVESRSMPAARYIEGTCEECSLFEICLPQVTRGEAANALQAAVRRLYQT